MEDLLASVVEFGAGAKLKDATGIRGDDCRGARGARVPHFLLEDFERGFRLRDVVNARRAAAVVGQRHFDKLDPGNRADQLSRSFADFLPVEEMAGILIRDTHFYIS